MSQQKVDKYKQDKANRQKIMKKEKVLLKLEITAVVVIAVGILGWFGFSVYSRVQESAPAKEYVLDTTAVDGYLNELYTSDSAE